MNGTLSPCDAVPMLPNNRMETNFDTEGAPGRPPGVSFSHQCLTGMSELSYAGTLPRLASLDQTPLPRVFSGQTAI